LSTSAIREYLVCPISINVLQWRSGYGSSASANTGAGNAFLSGDFWLRLVQDGTHRTLYYGVDGITWNQVY